MYFFELLRGLRRRWYILVVGLLVTGAGALYVYHVTPTRFEASATYMLLPPEEAIADSGNPYLVLGGLGQALVILTTRLNAVSTQDSLLPEGSRSTYSASADTTSGASFLNVTTNATSGEGAMSLLQAVGARARDSLASMQRELDVPSDSLIGFTVVVADEKAAQSSSTRLQLTLGVAAGGIVLTIVIAGAVDGLRVTRSHRRKQPRPSEPSEPADAADLVEETIDGTSDRTHVLLAAPELEDDTGPTDPTVASKPVRRLRGHNAEGDPEDETARS